MKKIIDKIKSSYDNLMHGTKLGYYLRKTVSTKNAYLLFIVFGSLVLLGTYVSYALFTVAQERDKAFKIVVGNLVSNIASDELDDTKSIVVEANSSRIATITLSNTNSVKAKYNLNYVVHDRENNIVSDAVNVKYVEASKDKPNNDGQYMIDSASSDKHTKEVKVILTNTTDTDKKVTFDAQVGLSTTPLKNKANISIVNQEFKYTYDPYADSINTTSIPYKEGDTQEKEFKIAYKTTDDESLYIKVNKDSVYMDVSETLDSQNVTTTYKSNYAGGGVAGHEIYIEHPQSTNSLSESNIFGQSNLTNIQNYFTFTKSSQSITKTNAFLYENIEPFLLKGNITNQTNTLDGQVITFGFYGRYKANADIHNFYDTAKFSILDENNHYIMPSFKLYTYNKTTFKTELEKLKKKVYDYDPMDYDVARYITKINNAINNYYNKRKVTQKEFDELLTDLGKGPSLKDSLVNIKDLKKGFINKDTGEIQQNDSYPNAIYSDFITLKAGQKYHMINNLFTNNKDDGIRFRVYDTNEVFKEAITEAAITSNDYATFTLKSSNGFYMTDNVEIVPKQDIKLRIMFINNKYVTSCFLFEEK